MTGRSRRGRLQALRGAVALEAAQVARSVWAKSTQLAMTLPWRSRITLTGFPSFSALPRQIPLESFCNPETLEYPLASICDFA
jgi:hypothetical protein